MLTLSALMEATPNAVRRRAALQCAGTLTTRDQSFAEKLRGTRANQYRELRFQVRCTDGIRNVTIRFHSGGKISTTSLVWVSCSCPYWCFYCEVAVASAGSSQIILSNGQAPKVRNPNVVPYLCKHLYQAAAKGIKALKETTLPDGFFYETGPRKKLDDRAKDKAKRYLIPEDERDIPWAGTPGFKVTRRTTEKDDEREAAAYGAGATGDRAHDFDVDLGKPTLVTVSRSLRERLAQGKTR